MCVEYESATPEEIERYMAPLPNERPNWPRLVYQDYAAPVIRSGPSGDRTLDVGSFGFVPQRHRPWIEDKKTGKTKRLPLSTMNARSETIGSKANFAKYWRAGNVCLIPMLRYFEPSWESGSAVRWSVAMANGQPFCTAGLWRTWIDQDEAGKESECLAFTAITMQANEPPIFRRLHKDVPGEPTDKRSLIIIPPEAYDDWLNCRDPEMARAFFQLPPAELLVAGPAPKPPKPPKE